MNLESTLYYVTHHSESIIQWLFFTILLLSAAIIARSLFAKKAVASAGAGGTEIESFLQKILEQTAKLEAVSLEKMTPASAADVDAQVQTLKAELASREQELSKLKAGGDSKPSADADKLGARIKELESKLSEYEILEDDIADLSLYKEENARLKTQLEELKGGGATPAPAAVAADAVDEAPPSVASKATTGDEIVAEFAQAVSQETVPSAPVEGIKETGDPIIDFANALSLEKKVHGVEAPPISFDGEVAAKAVAPPPAPAPAPPPVAAPEPVVEMAPPAPVEPPRPAPVVAAAPTPAATEPAAPVEGDDLFAEFANPPPEPEALDTDKMMSEMEALVGMEGAASGPSALDEGIDTEKMALEATKLVKA